MSRYDVAGHAAEHLSSASAPFAATALLAVILWSTPGARRRPDVLLAGLVWWCVTVAVMAGNLRVVDDLVRAGYSTTPTSSVPDVADHGLANASVWWALAAAVAFVAVFHLRGFIGTGATIGALAAMVVPPWIFPGAGMVVVAIACCVRRSRRHSQDRITTLPACRSTTLPTPPAMSRPPRTSTKT